MSAHDARKRRRFLLWRVRCARTAPCPRASLHASPSARPRSLNHTHTQHTPTLTQSAAPTLALLDPTASVVNKTTAALSAVVAKEKAVLSTFAKYAYVANFNDNSVTACSVEGGALVGCVSTAASQLNGPYGIAVTDKHAWMPNFNDNTVTVCARSGLTLSACAKTGSNFVNPSAIAFAGGFAYVTNQNGQSVTSCSVVGATLVNCVTTGSQLNGPGGIALA